MSAGGTGAAYLFGERKLVKRVKSWGKCFSFICFCRRGAP